MTITSIAAPKRYPGRLLVALGFGLAALGVIGYVVQFKMDRLWAPWYVPILATLGVLCVVVALVRAFSVWRVLALALVLLFAGLTWAFMFIMRLPAYDGPVRAGQPFPAFTTARADGTPFTQHDLEGDRDNVMVFFRGRW